MSLIAELKRRNVFRVGAPDADARYAGPVARYFTR